MSECCFGVASPARCTLHDMCTSKCCLLAQPKQIAGCAMSACEYEPIFAGTADGEPQDAAPLTITKCVPADGMQQLLCALRPGGVPAVHVLHLSSCRLDPADMLRWTGVAAPGTVHRGGLGGCSWCAAASGASAV